MGEVRRQAARLAVAVMLPLLILAGFQLYSAVNDRRVELETLSRARAVEVIRIADAAVLAELKLATALASTASVQNGDVEAARARASEMAKASGGWRNVRLSDPARKIELFDLGLPPGAAPGAAHPDALAFAAGRTQRPTIGGIERGRDGNYVIPMQAPVMRDGRLRYVLTVDLAPDPIHRLAVAHFPAQGVVSAVVDRQGRFISRTLRYEERVGQASSTYVQAAVRRGGEGFYRGSTLEGAPTFTAYVTSPLTGWSAHVAVAAGPFDVARSWSVLIVVGVTLGCIGLSGLMIWLTLRDFSRARQDDERLRQAQKMEAIGQLTGGIAHDFNNLLTAIIGGLDLIISRQRLDDRDQRYAQGALEAAQRGAKLTARLLAFSRTQRLGVEAVDIQATLDSMAELLDQSLGPAIAVHVDIDPEARWVTTDRNQLELALLNLAVNARDAMPEGGSLTFRARRTVHRTGRREWPCVALSVSDTGEGMDRQTLARALDPFFTTKPVGKGTGLGLAQVYGLVRQSGGDVRMESEVGAGTTVNLLLPIAEAGGGEGASAPDQDSGDQGRSVVTRGRILILDDDETVRDVLADNLRSRGFTVFEAATGEDALNVLQQIEPDLFVLDFLMPGINGAEVAKRAREIRPGQKMLVVSGHLDSVAFGGALVDIPILRKPFDGPTLAFRVSQIIASGASGDTVSSS